MTCIKLFLDKDKVRSRHCLVCYGFEKEAHPILPRPHGNSNHIPAHKRAQLRKLKGIHACLQRMLWLL